MSDANRPKINIFDLPEFRELADLQNRSEHQARQWPGILATNSRELIAREQDKRALVGNRIFELKNDPRLHILVARIGGAALTHLESSSVLPLGEPVIGAASEVTDALDSRIQVLRAEPEAAIASETVARALDFFLNNLLEEPIEVSRDHDERERPLASARAGVITMAMQSSNDFIARARRAGLAVSQEE